MSEDTSTPSEPKIWSMYETTKVSGHAESVKFIKDTLKFLWKLKARIAKQDPQLEVGKLIALTRHCPTWRRSR